MGVLSQSKYIFVVVPVNVTVNICQSVSDVQKSTVLVVKLPHVQLLITIPALNLFIQSVPNHITNQA
jgi:hypothetical protein